MADFASEELRGSFPHVELDQLHYRGGRVVFCVRTTSVVARPGHDTAMGGSNIPTT
jgi:hypothetical protein